MVVAQLEVSSVQKLGSMAFRSDRLKELRKEKKYTQGRLAELVGSSQSNVSSWETGVYAPSADELQALAKEFQVSIDYLLGLSDKRKGVLTWSDLPEDEKALIESYQEAKHDFKRAILKFLGNSDELIDRVLPRSDPGNLIKNDGD